MIAPHHQERRALIQDKVQERNTQLNVGHNFLPILYHGKITNIIYTYAYTYLYIHTYTYTLKLDDLTLH
jgi:hypothetical protein